MKIPIPKRAIDAAIEYERKSNKFTHNHPGWEGGQKKEQRIQHGTAAQFAIIDFLTMNEIPIKCDTSSYDENDEFDFTLFGKTYDVKTTALHRGPCSANTVVANKGFDFIVGTRICYNFEWIEILGVAPFDVFCSPQYFLKHQARIPYSDKTVTYANGGYFYTGRYESFFKHFGFIDSFAHRDHWHNKCIEIVKAYEKTARVA